MLDFGLAGSPHLLVAHETRGRDEAEALPFLLQRSEVFFEGRADLVEQLHQGMAEEAGAGRLGVEVICCRPAERVVTGQGTPRGCPQAQKGLAQGLTGSGKSPAWTP